MPKFLEKKLMAEYGPNSSIPYKVMNSIGAMHGNKTTPKGERMQAQHDAKQRALKSTMPTLGHAEGRNASLASHPHAARLGRYLHPKKSR